jgi:GTP-binding protein EngB required for normal cell division
MTDSAQHKGELLPRKIDKKILAEISKAVCKVLEQAGTGFARYVETVQNLLQRLSAERIHLAVIGQFKRGKSTFLNALLGEQALPASIIPLTAVPTFIRYGESPKVRISYRNHKSAVEFSPKNNKELLDYITGFVSETENPRNKLQVLQVEVFLPKEILLSGVVLIDTPGIGSTHLHNTETTLNFLPQCDAAFFMVSADPPITDVEVKFLDSVRERVKRLIFIFNKIDYLTEEEAATSIQFLRDVMNEKIKGSPVDRIFPISAREGLAARAEDNTEKWGKSGMREVEKFLLEFLAKEKTEVLSEAVYLKIADVVKQAEMQFDLTLNSLKMPLVELDKSYKTLESVVREAEIERERSQDILEGDKKRLLENLENYAEEIRQKALVYLENAAQEQLRDGIDNVHEKNISDTVASVVPGFFEHELGEILLTFNDMTGHIFSSHRQRADALIEKIRRTASDLLHVSCRSLSRYDSMEVKKEPYWVTHNWNATLSPIPNSVIDKLMPGKIRKKRIMKRILWQITNIVISNVENIRWATRQNIEETLRRFSNDFDERLEQTIKATYGAIKTVHEQRHKRSEEISGEVNNFTELSAELSALSVSLGKKIWRQRTTDAVTF